MRCIEFLSRNERSFGHGISTLGTRETSEGLDVLIGCSLSSWLSISLLWTCFKLRHQSSIMKTLCRPDVRCTNSIKICTGQEEKFAKRQQISEMLCSKLRLNAEDEHGIDSWNSFPASFNPEFQCSNPSNLTTEFGVLFTLT